MKNIGTKVTDGSAVVPTTFAHVRRETAREVDDFIAETGLPLDEESLIDV